MEGEEPDKNEIEAQKLRDKRDKIVDKARAEYDAGER